MLQTAILLSSFFQSDEELEMGDSLDDQETSLKSGEEENEIQKLWSKKEQLRRVKEQRERQQACVQVSAVCATIFPFVRFGRKLHGSCGNNVS